MPVSLQCVSSTTDRYRFAMTESPTFNDPPLRIDDLLRSRRTIHKFLSNRPDDAIILEAIESARWAQNHRLTEPWNVYLVGPVTAAAISELNYEIVLSDRGEEAAQIKLERWLAIPSWLVMTCNRSDNEFRQREDYAACCCAIQNLALSLWSEGVGMKWGTGPVTRDHRFYKLIAADLDSEDVVGLFSYGYPAVVPAGNRTRSVEEIVQTTR
jgi:nitroreductase